MTIDPLTAPKAISESSMDEFYQYMMKLKKLDLMLFKNVLLKVKKDPNIDIEKYIEQIICKTKKDYSEIEDDVKKLYRKNKLSYKAEKNPFIWCFYSANGMWFIEKKANIWYNKR